MNHLLVLTVILLPAATASAESVPVRPGSAEGQRIVHQLARLASEAFVAQTQVQAGADGAGSCDTVKDSLRNEFARLELKDSGDLLGARDALEKGPCDKSLFAVTAYLRSADRL